MCKKIGLSGFAPTPSGDVSTNSIQKPFFSLLEYFVVIQLMVKIMAPKVKVGDKAPDFTLPSQTGEEITLSIFLGKKNVVLYFYPMNRGLTCKNEACGFRYNYEALKELGAEVIGISSDSVELARASSH